MIEGNTTSVDSTMEDICFHCGEPLPKGANFSALIGGTERAMCCPGCKAVAETIRDHGLEKYYHYRTAPAPRPEPVPALLKREQQCYDAPGMQTDLVETVNGNRVVSLILDDINCPACCWLIETSLGSLAGVSEAVVNYSNNRCRVTWDPESRTLGGIINHIASLGYRAWPYSPDRMQQRMETERKAWLRRLALAGLLGMQVMMIAVALYTGAWTGIEEHYRSFFSWLSLFLTLPVVAYSGAPFFRRAWRDLRLLSPGMDVPVSLGIGIAFLASCSNTLAATGEIYFDSVVMFIFLLTLGRYLEFMARKKSVERIELLRSVLPAFATRVVLDKGRARLETVAVSQLDKGDRILIRPGETIPADGTVLEGVSSVDESILTGESLPVRKIPGTIVHGGSTNIDSPIQVQVEHLQQESLIARIHRLMDEGREAKPHYVELANRVAGWFILFVLGSAAATGVYWYHANPALWLPITISVLIVTCPCALSLAMPTAFASATGAMMERGVAVARPGIMEKLAGTTHVLFDKTGTLTEGRLLLETVTPYGGREPEVCLVLAAGLEMQSEHPVARAITAAAADMGVPCAENVINYPGEGITGTIKGRRYYLGSEGFIRRQTGHTIPQETRVGNGRPVTYLADDAAILAGLDFSDTLRGNAAEVIQALHIMGKTVAILSGDTPERVEATASSLGIAQHWARHSPDEKLSRIRELQEQGATVLMVGDGINDAPVLAAADISVAMGDGTDLVRASADIVLLSGDPASLVTLLHLARKTMRIIRQNLTWALAYNGLALPAAASGFVHPWMAAIGMSLSSLLVVLNSGRLGGIHDNHSAHLHLLPDSHS